MSAAQNEVYFLLFFFLNKILNIKAMKIRWNIDDDAGKDLVVETSPNH